MAVVVDEKRWNVSAQAPVGSCSGEVLMRPDAEVRRRERCDKLRRSAVGRHVGCRWIQQCGTGHSSKFSRPGCDDSKRSHTSCSESRGEVASSFCLYGWPGAYPYGFRGRVGPRQVYSQKRRERGRHLQVFARHGRVVP